MKHFLFCLVIGLLGCQHADMPATTTATGKVEPPSPDSNEKVDDSGAPYTILSNPEGGSTVHFKFVEAEHDDLFEVIESKRKEGAHEVPIAPDDYQALGLEIPLSVWQICSDKAPCKTSLPADSVQAEVGEDPDGFDYYIEGRIKPCMEKAANIILVRPEVPDTLRYTDVPYGEALKLSSDGTVVEGKLHEGITQDDLRGFLQDWVSGMRPATKEQWEGDVLGVSEKARQMDWAVELKVVNAGDETVLSLTSGAYAWAGGGSLCDKEIHEYLDSRMFVRQGGAWHKVEKVGDETVWSFDAVVYAPGHIEMLVFDSGGELSWLQRDGEGFRFGGSTILTACTGCDDEEVKHPQTRDCE